MIFKKPLAAIPRRLQGMRMQLQAYDIEVIYQPGSTLHIADLLSRSHLPTKPDPNSEEFEHVNMAQFPPIPDERLTEIKVETEADATLQLLKETILQGWPDNKEHVPPQIFPYFSTRDELFMQDGLVFRGERHKKQAAHIAHGCRIMPKKSPRVSFMAWDICRNKTTRSTV